MKKIITIFLSLIFTTTLSAQRFQVGDLYYQMCKEEEFIPDTAGWNIPAECLTVAQAREICAALENGATTGTKYYVKGWVKKLASKHEDGVNNYNNAVFFIEDVKDANSQEDFEAYQVFGPNGSKITSLDQVLVGDYVVLYGELTNCYGTYETVGKGAAYIWKSTNPLLAGSDNPDNDSEIIYEEGELSVAQALATAPASGDTTDIIKVRGKVKYVKTVNLSYGNAQFYITDDGNNELYCYNIKGVDGEKFVSGEQLVEGDIVTVEARLYNYASADGDLLELIKGNLTRTTNTFDPSQATGPKEVTVAEAYAEGSLLGQGETSSGQYKVTGVVTEVTEASTSYGNLTFSIIDEDGTQEMICYRFYYLDNKKYSEEDPALETGDIVTIVAQIKNHYGEIEFISGYLSEHVKEGQVFSAQQTIANNNAENCVVVTYESWQAYDNYVNLNVANIPATVEYNGKTYEVIGISEGAFANSPITSVTIPNSIKTIGYGAFENCQNLTTTFHTGDLASWCEIDFEGWESNPMQYTHNLYLNIPGTSFAEEVKGDIVIPNTVDTIHSHAFMGATSFTSITIPESVMSIEHKAFYGCSSLTSISIPNSVMSIEHEAFYGCSSLTSISIPNSVMSIGDVTFGECSSLTSITIPNSVTYIGESAFYGCSSLEYLSIPNSVKFFEIEEDGTEYFFDGFSCIVECYNLKTLTVPADFFGVYDLMDYYEGDYMEWFAYLPRQLESLTINGGNMTHPFGWDFMIQNRKSLKHIDFGATESIAEEAFNNFYNLESLVLPSQLETIPYMAVAECVKLKSISIPATVTTIEDRAFENCRMLSSVTFSKNGALTRIGNWAFYNNHELTNLVIPEGVTEVGHAAFYGCTYLKEMTLSSTVQDIADNGFALCAKLQRINVDATIPPTVAARTFEEVNRSIPVYVPDEVVSAYQSAPIWQEFNIQGKSNAPAGVEDILTPSPSTNIQKLLRDGQLIIIRDGVEYNAMGQEIH